MQEPGRPVATEQARDADLPARGRQQVDAPNHEINTLPPIVDCDGELIGPVAVTIAQQYVAALRRGFLLLNAEPDVVERFDARLHPQPPPISVGERQVPLAAVTRVIQL